MTIAEQIARLEREREALARLVASLDEEAFLRKGNGWAPRDVVAHLVGWNRALVEGARQIQRGELPFYDVDPGENYSKVNARFVAEHASTDRDELLGELAASARALAAYLAALDPETWARDFGVRHRGQTITIRDSVDELIDDYAHHRAQIERWVGRRP